MGRGSGTGVGWGWGPRSRGSGAEDAGPRVEESEALSQVQGAALQPGLLAIAWVVWSLQGQV